MKLTEEQVENWAQTFETTGRLPEAKIPCVECGTGSTATHGNLRNKVARAGGIRPLLSTFTCRGCVSAQRVALRPAGLDQTSGPRAQRGGVLAQSSPRRGKKNTDATPKNTSIPAFVQSPRVAYSVEELSHSAELTREFTQGCCLRPNIRLDDECCDRCPLVENCQAGCRLLSKRLQRALARA